MINKTPRHKPVRSLVSSGRISTLTSFRGIISRSSILSKNSHSVSQSSTSNGEINQLIGSEGGDSEKPHSCRSLNPDVSSNGMYSRLSNNALVCLIVRMVANLSSYGACAPRRWSRSRDALSRAYSTKRVWFICTFNCILYPNGSSSMNSECENNSLPPSSLTSTFFRLGADGVCRLCAYP